MNQESKRLAIAALKAQAGNAEDNYRRAKCSSYGWAPSYAESAKREWDAALAAVRDLEQS